MDLQIGLYKKHGQSVLHDSLNLVNTKEFLYEWTGIYESRVLVRARFKKGWSVINSSDIFIDYEFLRQAGITLGYDKKEIAQRINVMISESMTR